MEQGFGLLLQDALDFLFGVVVGGFQRALPSCPSLLPDPVWTIVKGKDPSLLGRQSGNGSMQSGQDDFPFEIAEFLSRTNTTSNGAMRHRGP